MNRSRRIRSIDREGSLDSRPTLSGQIRSILEGEIYSRELRPGDHLNELALVERFEASRTPIREALRQLQAQGLVEIVPRKGAFVARVSFKSLIELIEMATELESICARLAAERITAEQVSALVELHTRLALLSESSGVSDRFFEVSSDFYKQIFAATQNSALQALASSVYDRLFAYRRKQLDQANCSPQLFSELTELLDAIIRGDNEIASKMMRAHRGEVRGNVLRLLWHSTN